MIQHHNEGYNYRLVSYRNLVTKEQYSVESVQKEIKAENRIGMLEQSEQRVVDIEKKMNYTQLNDIINSREIVM